MDHLPELTTARLVLNRFTETDIPHLMSLCSDEQIAATTLAIPHPYTEDIGRQWIFSHDNSIREDAAYPFAIRMRETGDLIGCIGLHPNLTHCRAEIGYWVGVPHWGKGYCTQAGHEIIRFGFEDLGLNAITCGYFVGNTASEHVMANLGITLEGVRRQHYKRHGRFIDLAVGTLLRSDWRKR